MAMSYGFQGGGPSGSALGGFEGQGLFQRVPFGEVRNRHSYRCGRYCGVNFYQGNPEERRGYEVHAGGHDEYTRGRCSNNRGNYKVEERKHRGSDDAKYSKTRVKQYRHEGVYAVRELKDVILTLNLVKGDNDSDDKIITAENKNEIREFRIWSPFTSKLAASIIRGIVNIYIRRGSRVLYLGDGSCPTLSYVSDIVGHEGYVYALETSLKSNADLLTMAKSRKNIKPIGGDPANPAGYQRKIQGLVDVIYCDLEQVDQATLLALNARYFLKFKGNYMISVVVNGANRTQIEAALARELLVLVEANLKPLESISLEPYAKNRYTINGIYLKKRDVYYQKFCSRLLT